MGKQWSHDCVVIAADSIQKQRSFLTFIPAFQWYSIIVSYSLFRQIKTPVAVIRSDRKDAEANTAEELSNLKRGNGEAGAVPPTDSPK